MDLNTTRINREYGLYKLGLSDEPIEIIIFRELFSDMSYYEYYDSFYGNILILCDSSNKHLIGFKFYEDGNYSITRGGFHELKRVIKKNSGIEVYRKYDHSPPLLKRDFNLITDDAIFNFIKWYFLNDIGCIGQYKLENDKEIQK
ncbi:MAG TPA: hypothetical protein GX708_15755 [Gallicola sp.]|nr:hypothetical protein [Gallicola sp.]